MQSVIQKIEEKFKKAQVLEIRSGDTVRVHQKIKEGNKERVQWFHGLVIRTDRKGGHLSRITVRRIAHGIGVEKSFLVHSPLIVRIEITKRSKVNRNYLSYMRDRTGKAARMSGTAVEGEDTDNLEPAVPADAPEVEQTEEPAAK